MLLIFKKKVLNVDCFTSSQSAHDLYPINYSNKFFPDWWKELPKSYLKNNNDIVPIPTMKSCAGFIDFHRNGMMIPMWSDIVIGINKERGSYRWQFSDLQSEAMSHDLRMMTGCVDFKEFVHLKLFTPWLISCKEDILFTWVGNTWAFNNPHEVIIPPASVSYKYNNSNNINMFLREPKDGNALLIKQGTPLVNIIPQSERKLKIHLHLLSKEEYTQKKERLIPTSFLKHYSIHKKIIENQEKEKSRCPFNWRRNDV